MASRAISVKLGAKHHEILRRQLESRRCESAAEVIDDALRLVDDRDAVFDEWLRNEVAASVADKRAPIRADTVFKRLEARHARRVKAAKRERK